MTDACLVSGFTTVGSNIRTTYRYEKLHYARLALDDGAKLLALANLARSFGYFMPGESREQDTPRTDVAFLAEASTFGYWHLQSVRDHAGRRARAGERVLLRRAGAVFPRGHRRHPLRSRPAEGPAEK
jgi:hypothetical protein